MTLLDTLARLDELHRAMPGTYLDERYWAESSHAAYPHLAAALRAAVEMRDAYASSWQATNEIEDGDVPETVAAFDRAMKGDAT